MIKKYLQHINESVYHNVKMSRGEYNELFTHHTIDFTLKQYNKIETILNDKYDIDNIKLYKITEDDTNYIIVKIDFYYFFISQLGDDWFLLHNSQNSGFYYKCDEIEGVIEMIDVMLKKIN